ncbi:endothelin-converting enzyme 2-like isoform X1 [Dermacentor variabilis]|uniref:endothelin-converting enzyme 2-like isoform X1 n=1 Tax=Dermacentor variabilis TaxID=34621 RepID=UPI003F5CA110
MHYLPRLRRLATRKKKPKPQLARRSQSLDFHTERTRSSTASCAAPIEMPSRPIDHGLRPPGIRERVATAVLVPEELRHCAENFPWRRAMHVAIASAVIVGMCVAALIVAWKAGVEPPICDEGCMLYTKLLNETMDWSVDPCQDFYRFVCGRLKNKSSVRRSISDRFIQAVADIARQEDVSAEGQTAAQKAARLFKSCEEIVTKYMDYAPRIRGYMRDANLHWPQHPKTRGIESVDVFRSILELNDKWGWPCLLELSPNYVSETMFEVVVRPTRGLDRFQHHVVTLGVGSAAHRTYFDALYDHYGGGILNGVTFEEMLSYEHDIMLPLLEAYHAPPRRYVFERNHSDTSGTWERWTSDIQGFYGLTGNERIEIATNHDEYFKQMIELIKTKETIVELVIGWMAVQFTAQFANRQLIANHYNTLEGIEELHRRDCFAFASYLMGAALFLPFLERFYSEPVRTDARRIAREVRRTVYQRLDRATYPWAELDVAFKYIEIARVDDIEARFSKYPEMEASFLKNLRDAIKANHRADIDDIGAMPQPWLFENDFYHPHIKGDRIDYALKPSILMTPMYHMTAPMPVRLATFGVEVAKATIESYMELRFQGHGTDLLDKFQFCFVDMKDKQRQEERTPQWISLVKTNMVDSFALDIALLVLKLVPSFDEDRLQNVPLTGHQLFYVVHCYTHCAEENGTSLCNDPLKHKEDFANVFSCPSYSYMRLEKCPSF